MVLRFSTVPGDLLDETVSTPRGLALKLLGVPGERADGAEGATTQDFVLVNGPVFGAPDAKHFLKMLKLLATTTDKVEPLKKAVSAVARGSEKVIEAFGDKSGAVIAHFAQHGGEWELRVQLCTDLASMPVKDASVEWPQAQSPYVSVARIRMPAQLAWSTQRTLAIDDGMAFNPWHALAAHRPLGSIMRARKVAYAAMAKLRAQQNRQPISEPVALPALA